MSIEPSELLPVHGKYATWAIWDDSGNNDSLSLVDFIEANKEILHCNYIIIGLNASSERTNDWGSFRNGKHDRKLKCAFSNLEGVTGCYMTDLFKIIEVKSSDLKKILKANPTKIPDAVMKFKEEMTDLNITKDTRFIILGRMANDFYRKHFKEVFPNIKVICYKHYSARGTDRDWISGIQNIFSSEEKLKKTLDNCR